MPLPRFPVPKGTGVRAVDDGSSTGSSANLFTRTVEKLQVPSSDQFVATAQGLHRLLRAPLGGWVLDELAAFRQLPVCPESRGVAVVGVCEPKSGKIAFFRMLSHPGLTQSVFNYNRRGCLLTSILLRVFSLVCLSFCDHRFGLTVKELAVEEAEIVSFVCMLLGVP